jgi:transposase
MESLHILEVFMRKERFVINDRSWALIGPLLPGTTRDRGVTAKDNRLFLEAVLWKVRVGAPWRDLPPGFGEWNSVFRRFRRWAQSGVFQRLFEAIAGDPDFEYVLIDGTIVSVHQKASGAKGGLSIRQSAGQKAD